MHVYMYVSINVVNIVDLWVQGGQIQKRSLKAIIPRAGIFFFFFFFLAGTISDREFPFAFELEVFALVLYYFLSSQFYIIPLFTHHGKTKPRIS
jgi:hypothetical protein